MARKRSNHCGKYLSEILARRWFRSGARFLASHGNPRDNQLSCGQNNWKGRKQILRVEESPGAQAVQVGDNSRVKIETNPSQTAQQLAELVYTPLLKEATSWLDPITPTYAVWTWSNLEAENPYLIRLVPKDIAEIFNRAKLAWVQMSSLNLALFGAYEKAFVAARQKLNLTQARPGQSQVTFRILSGPQFLGGVWLQKLWVSGKTLSEYGKEFVDTNFPGTDWELDLQIDGMTATEDNNTALQFAEVALTYLSHEPKAVELQKKYSELRKLGIKARPRIDEELGKLVR